MSDADSRMDWPAPEGWLDDPKNLVDDIESLQKLLMEEVGLDPDLV